MLPAATRRRTQAEGAALPGTCQSNGRIQSKNCCRKQIRLGMHLPYDLSPWIPLAKASHVPVWVDGAGRFTTFTWNHCLPHDTLVICCCVSKSLEAQQLKATTILSEPGTLWTTGTGQGSAGQFCCCLWCGLRLSCGIQLADGL